MYGSKTKINKCNKGLHEFIETKYTEKTKIGSKKLWACRHCGVFINNR